MTYCAARVRGADDPGAMPSLRFTKLFGNSARTYAAPQIAPTIHAGGAPRLRGASSARCLDRTAKACCAAMVTAVAAGITTKPRQVLFRPSTGRPLQRRPASIGRASSGARSSVMTATCTRPAIRIGAVSHTARSARDVTDAGGSTNAGGRTKTRRRRASPPIHRARPGATIHRQSPPPPGTILAPSFAGVGRGWIRITGVGVVAILLASVPFAKDGRRRGASFVVAALGSFLIQQVLIARALTLRDEGQPDDLDAVDALTLSRGLAASIVAAAAIAGPHDRRRYATRIAWALALSGSTLTDWIDGPLARRRGPTRLGRVLDLELDSWLTLATTLAGTRL